MRCVRERPRVGAIGLTFCLASLWPASALAGSAQAFPVPSHLVPAAVAAAFILPAAAASVSSILRRVGRSRARRLGLSLLAAGAFAALAYVNPDVLATLRL